MIDAELERVLFLVSDTGSDFTNARAREYLLLTSASYWQDITERPEFGWRSHFSPVRAWCDACGWRMWSQVHGECPLCSDDLAIGVPVYCLLSGDLPKPMSRSLERRRPRFVAHKSCFEKSHPQFSN
jgi:hypothetical protein